MLAIALCIVILHRSWRAELPPNRRWFEAGAATEPGAAATVMTMVPSSHPPEMTTIGFGFARTGSGSGAASIGIGSPSSSIGHDAERRESTSTLELLKLQKRADTSVVNSKFDLIIILISVTLENQNFRSFSNLRILDGLE